MKKPKPLQKRTRVTIDLTTMDVATIGAYRQALVDTTGVLLSVPEAVKSIVRRYVDIDTHQILRMKKGAA